MLIWWRIWHDDDRRVWADRQLEGDPATAKRKHAADCRFDWVEHGHAPAVSGLEFYSDDQHSHLVAAGTRRDSPADRQWQGATLTPTKPSQPQPPAAPDPTVTDDDDLPF